MNLKLIGTETVRKFYHTKLLILHYLNTYCNCDAQHVEKTSCKIATYFITVMLSFLFFYFFMYINNPIQ